MQRGKSIQRRSSTTFVLDRRRQDASRWLEKMRWKYRLLQERFIVRYYTFNTLIIFITFTFLPRSDEEKEKHTLTFNVSFPHDRDTVYLAHCYPYTYTDLQVIIIIIIIMVQVPSLFLFINSLWTIISWSLS